MPIFRASAPTPPATRIASSSPTSLIGAFLYYYSSTVEKYRPRRAMVNSPRLWVPASLGQSASVRPFPNQLIVIGVFRIISRCNIYFAALRKRPGLVWFTTRSSTLILRCPNIALNFLGGHLGSWGDRFSGCFSPRGLASHLCRTLSGPIVRLAAEAAANHSRDLLSQLVRHFQRSETRHRARRVEVPRILRKPDEIPDLGIGGPRATKRRTGQFSRHAGREKGSDIGLGGDRFDRRQLRWIERKLGRFARAAARSRDIAPLALIWNWMHAFRRHLGRSGRLRCFGVFRRLTLAPRPARNEIFRLAHSRSFGIGPRRASASGSARSRSRLWNGRSTWRSATKASIAARTASGIGTTSTRSLPVSVQASPSAGSAVTAKISYGGSTPVGRSATQSMGAPEPRLSR